MIIFSAATIFSNSHCISGHFSYPQISGINSDSIKFKADWGLEYTASITDRFYGTFGFDNAFWIKSGQNSGTDYTSLIAGVSYDVLKTRFAILNAGCGGGLLFHFYQGIGKDYYPHYFLNISPQFPINDRFSLGLKYSLSNGANENILNESVSSFGIEGFFNLSGLIEKIAQNWRISEGCKDKRFTGYNIAGYSFLYAGLLCTVVSIPFFIDAFKVTPNSDVSFAADMTFGFILLGSGAILELGSIPFFVLHKKKVCGK